ncbi:hypothetical protein [Pandoraea terrigena]|uniref:hypothetical protein n=1 Tax=Pandoraea terrigena TaxID=2508292 RepID=UPI001240CDD5|nr:hypothetical protein [Pandoraea terrigena]
MAESVKFPRILADPSNYRQMFATTGHKIQLFALISQHSTILCAAGGLAFSTIAAAQNAVTLYGIVDERVRSITGSTATRWAPIALTRPTCAA